MYEDRRIRKNINLLVRLVIVTLEETVDYLFFVRTKLNLPEK